MKKANSAVAFFIFNWAGCRAGRVLILRMNLSEAVRTWAMRNKDAIALSGSDTMTFGELDYAADICAKHLIKYIPTGGERIAILTEDNLQFVIFLLGIIRSGNIFVLINPTLSTLQIDRSLQKIDCVYYISGDKNKNLSGRCIFVPLGNKCERTSYDSKLYFQRGVGEETGIIFSSGTTGEPKALKRSSFSILSETIQWIIELQLHRGMSFLIPRPLYYTGGFILMYASLFAGCRVDLLDNLSCENILAYMQKEPVDWAFIVPSVIREMLTYTNYNHMAENVLTMGSFIYHSEKMAFHKKFSCNIIEVWGNSEGLGTITETKDLYEHPGTIGKPFFTDYLDVSRNDEGVAGGILFGISDNEFSEYVGKPELTREVLHDGYIFSEDIGYRDEEGYFYLTGRVKDIIVVNGIKVFPADIEKELQDTGKITDCTVFSVADHLGNEVVSAALVMSSYESPEEVINSVNYELAPHERIHKYVVVDSIPRNHGGKVDRNFIIEIIKQL